MSFEDFAKRTAGTPEAVAGAAARAAELARKPFAEAFVNEVYPHWQGPLKSISGKQGVESVTHGHVAGFLPVPETPGFTGRVVLTEVLTVSTHVGVRAVVSYAFTGDATDGVVSRVAGFAEHGPLVLATEGPASPVVLARGPLPKLTEALVADVDAATNLFALMLIDGLNARQDRLAREEAEREAAAKAKAEAEQKAKDEAAAKEAERIETEAAAVRARKEPPPAA